jgi:hypothetical protein
MLMSPEQLSLITSAGASGIALYGGADATYDAFELLVEVNEDSLGVIIILILVSTACQQIITRCSVNDSSIRL